MCIPDLRGGSLEVLSGVLSEAPFQASGHTGVDAGVARLAGGVARGVARGCRDKVHYYLLNHYFNLINKINKQMNKIVQKS